MFFPSAHHAAHLSSIRSTTRWTRLFSSNLPRLKPLPQALPKATPKPPSRLPRSESRTPAQSGSLKDQNAARILAALYQAGQTTLYKVPSHKAFITASLLLGFTTAFGVWHFLSMGLWNKNKAKETGLKYPILISSVHAFLIGTFAFLTIIFLRRPCDYILAVKIVKHQESYKLWVTTRTAPLFRKPRNFVVSPKDLHLDRNVVGFVGCPETVTTDVGRQASQAAEAGNIFTKVWAVPYTAVRKIMFSEGVVHASLPGKKTDTVRVLLDTNGTDFEEMKHLIDVATIDY